MLVVYSYDTNIVHAEAFAGEFTQDIISGYDMILKYLISHDFTSQLLIINNEMYMNIKNFRTS